jgi:hypothetical protein
LLRGQKKAFCLKKKKSHSCKEWNILQKNKKTPKAGINTISGVSSFLMMPGPNQAKVLPIMEYSNNCPLNYY